MNHAKKSSDTDQLDHALEDTFPASDPVAHSDVEAEKERRRAVLEQDALEKQRHPDPPSAHTEAEMDEALEETFPASDPAAFQSPTRGTGQEGERAERRQRRGNRKKRAAGRQKKTPRRTARAVGRRTGQKRPVSKKRNSRRKKAGKHGPSRRKS